PAPRIVPPGAERRERDFDLFALSPVFLREIAWPGLLQEQPRKTHALAGNRWQPCEKRIENGLLREVCLQALRPCLPDSLFSFEPLTLPHALSLGCRGIIAELGANCVPRIGEAFPCSLDCRKLADFGAKTLVDSFDDQSDVRTLRV